VDKVHFENIAILQGIESDPLYFNVLTEQVKYEVAIRTQQAE
jgi:hypothetical protein